MGEVFRYHGLSLATVAELEAVLARGAASFQGFDGFSPGGAVSAYVTPGTLPPLARLAGARLRAVRVQGFLPLKADPFAAFSAILDRATVITARGSLSLSIGFAEAGSRPSKRYPSSIGIQIARGEAYFTFSPGSSRVADDVTYRREFMRRVAGETQVPVRLVETGGNFFLQHRTGGRLSLTDAGIGGTDPSAFHVQLQDASPAALVALMADFLARFAGPKRYEFSWLASPVFDGRQPEQMEEGPEIYEEILRAGFPAERYFIDATLLLDRLEGLDALKALCGADDELYTALATVPLPDGNYLNLKVVTTAAGHRVDGESRLPVDIEEIGRRLGLELADISGSS